MVDTYPSLITVESLNPLRVYIPNWAPSLPDDTYNEDHIFTLLDTAVDSSYVLEIGKIYRCRIPMNAKISSELRLLDLEEIVISDEARKQTLRWLYGPNNDN